MHQPMGLNTLPHHSQHVSALQAASVIMVQLTLGLGVGAGGMGPASAAFLAMRACAAFLNVEAGAGVGLQRSQSYTHMPTGVPGGPNGAHLQVGSEPQELTSVLVLQSPIVLEQVSAVPGTAGMVGMQNPMEVFTVGPHQLQHESSLQTSEVLCSEHPLTTGAGAAAGASTMRWGRALATARTRRARVTRANIFLLMGSQPP
eukprot:CAMPEP_0169445826 /NCGR_PEP_ID=MMETSP1042-20121227/10648_2 /TAXON_ID=464988 /ORGANISM="Hemiselmis andersenii, Strain CCMP1180" /LENGTH=201 /DNA_ID=CAMNT_0009557251 /DNA_START=484 /DNA_END=1085 /DNA_ORIENTATION=-